MKETLDIKR